MRLRLGFGTRLHALGRQNNECATVRYDDPFREGIPNP